MRTLKALTMLLLIALPSAFFLLTALIVGVAMYFDEDRAITRSIRRRSKQHAKRHAKRMARYAH